MKNIRGFTLIEISIVLVIIGLLAAGILVGRDLIRAAEVRAQISDINKFNLAANSFKLKYDCLPGDCLDAEEIGLGMAGGPGANGDGNKEILGNAVAGTILTPEESTNFWYHLSQAKMIGGNYKGYVDGMSFTLTFPGIRTPTLKLPSVSLAGIPQFSNGRGGVSILSINAMVTHPAPLFINLEPLIPDISKHYWLLSTNLAGGGGSLTPAGVYLPVDAYAIDSKIDDGMPRDGTVLSISRAMDTWTITPDTDAQPACADQSVTPFQYNILEIEFNNTTYRDLLCAVFIRAEF